MQRKRMSSFLKALNETDPVGYRPRREEVEAWYRFFNRHIFDNRLSRLRKSRSPEFYLVNLNRRKGERYWTWANTCLGFGASGKWMYWLELHKIFPSKKYFLDILAHEMIHLFQIEHEAPEFGNKEKHPKSWGHGKSFEKWRPKFEKLGLDFRTHFEYIEV